MSLFSYGCGAGLPGIGAGTGAGVVAGIGAGTGAAIPGIATPPAGTGA